MYNSLKKIDFEATLYWELKYGGYKLDKLYRFGMLSPNVIRAIEVADTIHQKCYIEGQRKERVEQELAKKYKIGTEAIKKIWQGITAYIEPVK